MLYFGSTFFRDVHIATAILHVIILVVYVKIPDNDANTRFMLYIHTSFMCGLMLFSELFRYYYVQEYCTLDDLLCGDYSLKVKATKYAMITASFMFACLISVIAFVILRFLFPQKESFSFVMHFINVAWAVASLCAMTAAYKEIKEKDAELRGLNTT
jgi:hypothetical protein